VEKYSSQAEKSTTFIPDQIPSGRWYQFQVLRENYLKPLRMSANALAKALSVPAPRINDVARGRRGISADTAMRLARYFGGDARSG
jgi:addiction module HigA family antidote